MNAPTLRMSCLAVLVAGLAACKPTPPPTDEPPRPQANAAEATQLRDAIQQPINKAKAVEGTVQQAADHQRAEMEAAEN